MRQLAFALNPIAVARHFARHRYLLFRLARREVEVRYRGSFLGVLWSLLTPLLMLGIYTFVFSVVFRARWGISDSEDRTEFALALFAGLTAFNLFSETVASAPGLILANTSYVKRVVFPLEILPLARFLANLVQASLSGAVFVGAVIVCRGTLCWTLVFLPLVLLPLSLLTLGCAYLLSSLGVFVRDIGQIVGLSLTALMFLSAIFYPVSALPKSWQSVLTLNPLVPMIENVRRVTLAGLLPDWGPWCIATLLSAMVAVAGLTWFMKSKSAFVDVI